MNDMPHGRIACSGFVPFIVCLSEKSVIFAIKFSLIIY